MDITVGKLIEELSKYPKDIPVYFGANFTIPAYGKDDLGYEVECEAEFDDWLAFKELGMEQQGVWDGEKTRARDVLILEMDY